MKTKITFLSFFLASFFFSNAQIGQLTNNQFQTWTSPHTPDGWMTLDSLFAGLISGTSVRDTNIKVSGEACSLELNAVANAEAPGGVAQGIAVYGSGVVNVFTPSFPGAPFTYRPDTIWFLNQYSTTTGDTGSVSIALFSSGTPILGVNLVVDTSSVWIWNYFVLTPEYMSEANPDTLSLIFSTSADTGRVGDVFHVQEVLFGYVTLPNGLKEIVDKLNISLYPNPSSQEINISAAGDVTGYKMIVSDINGKLVAIYTLEGTKSTFDVSNYASGTYLYRLADKQGNILNQDKFIVAK